MVANRLIPYRADRSRWNSLRNDILAAEPTCRVCAAAGRIRAAGEVDHIKPLHQGGAPWDRENLQPICRRCHAIKSAREMSNKGSPVCPHGYTGGEWDCPSCQQMRDRRKAFVRQFTSPPIPGITT